MAKTPKNVANETEQTNANAEAANAVNESAPGSETTVTTETQTETESGKDKETDKADGDESGDDESGESVGTFEYVIPEKADMHAKANPYLLGEMAVITVGKGVGTIEIDFDRLSDKGKSYLLFYGLRQALNDAHASIKKSDFKTEAEFFEKARSTVKTRLDSIYTGNVSHGGERSDPVEREMMALALKTVKEQIRSLTDKEGKPLYTFTEKGKRGGTYVAPEQVKTLAENYMKENDAELREQAEKIVEARKGKPAKDKPAVADSIKSGLANLLGGGK